MARRSQAWFAEGLKFECQPDCAGCCVNHGAYAYVYLEGDDVDRLADHLELTRRQFLRRHTQVDDGYRVLRMDEPVCPFLDGKRCSVYRSRPTQCRTFPFWSQNLKRRASWDRLGRFCPGINQGKLHSLRVIRTHLAARDG